VVPHPFSRADARVRIEQLLAYWTSRFGIRNHWDGDRVQVSGRVMGVNFEAELAIEEHSVDGKATDPGFFLRGAATNYINRSLRKYLHPRYEEV
jgi:hypothetical protein